MRLFTAEMHRIARRRLSWMLALFTIGGIVLVAAGMWFSSSTGPSEADLAYAQEQADAANAEYAACMADEDFFVTTPGYEGVATDPFYAGLDHEQLCLSFFVADAQAEDYIYLFTFHFDEHGVMLLVGVALVAGLMSMLLAASLIGAEWAAGGIANQLVWHPNRMRVWGAKLGATLTVAAAAVVAAIVLAAGLLYVTAAVRGDTGTLDGPWWQDTLGMLARALVMALGMTVVGASLAMVGRHTAIAGGVIAGYLIIGDMLARMAGGLMQMAFPERLSLYTWVAAWIDGRITLYDWTDATAMQDAATMTINATQAGALLGTIVLLVTALATWSFAKRDVT